MTGWVSNRTKFSFRLINWQYLCDKTHYMSRMKTICATFGLWITLGGPLAALTDAAQDRAPVFATCLGRASAEMEHRWLMGHDAKAEQDRRALFQMLLDMAAPGSGIPGRDFLDMRIRAKMAHAHLLQTATFHTDPNRKRRAQAAARRAWRPCSALILS